MTAPLKHEPVSGEAAPLSPEDREALAALAARFKKAWTAAGQGDPSLAKLDAFDKAIASGALKLDGDALPEDERQSVLNLFPGWKRPIAASMAAWLGEAIADEREGMEWRRGPGGELFLAGPPQAPNLMLRVARLTDAAFEGARSVDGERLSIAGELGRLDEGVELAAKVFEELDSLESQTEFQLKRAGRLAVMSGEELARWALSEAKLFRHLHLLLSKGEKLSYDREGGLLPLGRFAASARVVQPFSESARARLAIFLGETARRVWQIRRSDVQARWLWSTQRKTLALSARLGGEGEKDEWLFFPMEQLEQFFESWAPAEALAGQVEEFSARLDSAAAERPQPARLAAAAPPPATAPVNGEVPAAAATSFALIDDVKINPGILAIRSRLVKRYATDAPDLLLPCQRQQADGARALGVLPTSGMFFDNEAELRRQLTGLLARIVDHIPGRVEPDFTLFFTFIESSMSDLVILARPATERGGQPRLDFFLWDITEDRPGPVLTAKRRAQGELYDPIGRRIKEALFHLQQTGDATHARQLIEEALAQDPSRQSALLAMCQLHLAIGNQIMARGYVQAILQVAPKNIEARLLDSRFLLDEERFEEAIRRAKSIADEDRECAEAWVIMARAKAIMGRLDEAREHLDHALALEPSNSEGSMLKATIEGMQRQH
jgi:tetratricopeptide (TPR) repeat protein